MHRRGFTAQHDNRDQGAAFEKIFERQARHEGYLPIRTGQKCIWTGRGIQVLAGQLDYTVLERGNRTAFLDCKSWLDGHFTFSDINAKQLTQACLLNEWGHLAGFVCLDLKTYDVGFFSGHQIMQAGPGSGFDVREGLPLGRLETMSLRPIYEKKQHQGGEEDNNGVNSKHNQTLP